MTTAPLPTKAEPLSLLDVLVAMEIPARCGCRLRWLEFSVHLGHDDQGHEVKEKLRWLGPPCQHVLDKWHGWSVAKWARALGSASPALFAEPRLAACAMHCIDQAARLAIMMLRHAGRRAIRHPDDPDRNGLVLTRKRPDGTVEIVVDDEAGRRRAQHHVPRGLLVLTQAMATSAQLVRLVCQPGAGAPYTVWERDATAQDWFYASLRIEPEEYGREDDWDD